MYSIFKAFELQFRENHLYRFIYRWIIQTRKAGTVSTVHENCITVLV
jgi:hypothetical protein